MNSSTYIDFFNENSFIRTTDKPKVCKPDDCWLFDILLSNEMCRVQDRKGTKYKKFCRDSHRPDDYLDDEGMCIRGKDRKLIKFKIDRTKWKDMCAIDFDKLKAGMPHYLKKLL